VAKLELSKAERSKLESLKSLAMKAYKPPVESFFETPQGKFYLATLLETSVTTEYIQNVVDIVCQASPLFNENANKQKDTPSDKSSDTGSEKENEVTHEKNGAGIAYLKAIGHGNDKTELEKEIRYAIITQCMRQFELEALRAINRKLESETSGHIEVISKTYSSLIESDSFIDNIYMFDQIQSGKEPSADKDNNVSDEHRKETIKLVKYAQRTKHKIIETATSIANAGEMIESQGMAMLDNNMQSETNTKLEALNEILSETGMAVCSREIFAITHERAKVFALIAIDTDLKVFIANASNTNNEIQNIQAVLSELEKIVGDGAQNDELVGLAELRKLTPEIIDTIKNITPEYRDALKTISNTLKDYVAGAARLNRTVFHSKEKELLEIVDRASKQQEGGTKSSIFNRVKSDAKSTSIMGEFLTKLDEFKESFQNPPFYEIPNSVTSSAYTKILSKRNEAIVAYLKAPDGAGKQDLAKKAKHLNDMATAYKETFSSTETYNQEKTNAVLHAYGEVMPEIDFISEVFEAGNTGLTGEILTKKTQKILIESEVINSSLDEVAHKFTKCYALRLSLISSGKVVMQNDTDIVDFEDGVTHLSRNEGEVFANNNAVISHMAEQRALADRCFEDSLGIVTKLIQDDGIESIKDHADIYKMRSFKGRLQHEFTEHFVETLSKKIVQGNINDLSNVLKDKMNNHDRTHNAASYDEVIQIDAIVSDILHDINAYLDELDRRAYHYAQETSRRHYALPLSLTEIRSEDDELIMPDWFERARTQAVEMHSTVKVIKQQSTDAITAKLAKEVNLIAQKKGNLSDISTYCKQLESLSKVDALVNTQDIQEKVTQTISDTAQGVGGIESAKKMI